MRVYGRLAGFNYIYGTDQQDVAVVRFHAQGFGGLLRLNKQEWIIRRGDPESIRRCYSGLLLDGPSWAVSNGEASQAQAELDRWQAPHLYAAIEQSELERPM